MDVVKFLVLSPNPLDRIAFPDICRDLGRVRQFRSVESAAPEFESDPPDVLIVEQSLGDFRHYEGLLSARTSILLTGPNERAARETIVSWPAEFFLDYIPRPKTETDRSHVHRILNRAVEHARLRREERRLKDVYSEIREIKGFISNNIVREMEKRVSLQVRYLWFQRRKQKIEDILRKIYIANDVNSLLDTLSDIKDLVQASGITFYVIDENETLGKYLKPLVWDDAFLSHTEFSRYIALLDSEDFAAQAVRCTEDVNIVGIPAGPKLAKRYIEHLKSPPLRSLLGVPIRHEKKVIGVLEVSNKLHKGEPSKLGFTAEDSQVLRGISEHISLAMTKLNLIHYDALTGLLRPDPFFDKVIQKISLRSKRRQEIASCAMVMGDVDWFKHYNDRNGHEAGNRLLRQLGAVLKTSIREADLLCRYGGEEFLFFLAGVNSLEEACILTERIRKNVEETYFESEEVQPRNNLTMSFGVTMLPRKEDFYSTINRYELKKIANEADMALAEAKGKRFMGGRTPGESEKEITKNKVCAYQRENAGQNRTEPVIKSYRQEFFEEKRKTPRHYISTLLLYQENGGLKVTRTINLSLGGLRMMSDAKLPLAKSLNLFLVLEDKATSLKGDIVYCRKSEEDAAQFYTGIRFRGMEPSDRKALENFLLTISKREASD